jgi:hypothetical protein
LKSSHHPELRLIFKTGLGSKTFGKWVVVFEKYVFLTKFATSRLSCCKNKMACRLFVISAVVAEELQTQVSSYTTRHWFTASINIEDGDLFSWCFCGQLC